LSARVNNIFAFEKDSTILYKQLKYTGNKGAKVNKGAKATKEIRGIETFQSFEFF
jgi:hypothetical protein